MWKFKNPEEYRSKDSLEILRLSLDQDQEQDRQKLGRVLNNIGVGYYGAEFGYEKDYEQALNYLQQAAELGTSPAEVNLGLLYCDEEWLGHNDVEAERHFIRAAEMGDGVADYYLGELYLKQNRKELAESHFCRASESENDEVRYYVGKTFFKQGRYESAAAVLESLKVHRPSIPIWYNAQYLLFQAYSEHLNKQEKAISIADDYMTCFKRTDDEVQQVDKLQEAYQQMYEYLANSMLHDGSRTIEERILDTIVKFDYPQAYEMLGDAFFNGTFSVDPFKYDVYQASSKAKDLLMNLFERDDSYRWSKNITIAISWNYEKAKELYKKAADLGDEAARKKLEHMQQYQPKGEYEDRFSLEKRLQNLLAGIGDFYVRKLRTQPWPLSFDYNGLRLDFDEIAARALRALNQVKVRLSDDKPEYETQKGIDPEELKRQLEGMIQKVNIWILQLDRRVNVDDQGSQSESILRILQALLDCLNRIKSLLDNGVDPSGEDMRSVADEAIALFDHSQEIMMIPGELMELLTKFKHYYCMYTILGIYDCHANEIVLYIENIKDSVSRLSAQNRSPVLLEARLLSVLAHETFHAFHYECIKACGVADWWEKDDYSCKVIQESLARYAEYLYCLERERKMEEGFSAICSGCRREWGRETVSLWPYAGAKYYDRADGMFQKEFHLGLDSYEGAKKLLNTCRYLENMSYKVRIY